MIMTCYRFTAFGVMIITVLIGLANKNPFSDGTSHIAPNYLFHWAGFATMFTSAAVATNFHYNVPDVIKPMKTKMNAGRMVTLALGTAVVFYASVGVLCAMYFGDQALPLATLNWSTYTGMEGGWGGDVKNRPPWAYIVQLWVMLFPVFDMLSVYPLVSITLGNNLLETLPKTQRISPRIAKLLSRFTAAIPPLILAAAVGRLDSIFAFTGLTAFFLELIFPCLLQLLSIRYCIVHFGKGSERTPYSTFFSHSILAGFTMIFGLIALGFAVVVFVRTYL